MKVEVEVLKDGSKRLMHRQLAKVLVKKGLVRIVEAETPDLRHVTPPYRNPGANGYETSVLQAAPYGYKADGTPRLRPGRPAKAE